MKHLLLLVIPLMVLTGCGQQVVLHGSENQLAERSMTEQPDVVVFPDDNPSLPDGKATWNKMNCAQCHGSSGEKSFSIFKGNKTPTVSLNNPGYAGTQKPLEQYVFLAYGKKGVSHPVLSDRLTRREIWNLVFFTRSLATKPLSDDEWAKIDPVFGSNCAVCHGKRGFGDGPLSRNMNPVPANFHQFDRFYDRTDNQLWDHIAYGIKWEAMPNFLGKQDRAKNVKFDQGYIRKLVMYVRAFSYVNKSTASERNGR